MIIIELLVSDSHYLTIVLSCSESHNLKAKKKNKQKQKTTTCA